jgi:hypothetical protein
MCSVVICVLFGGGGLLWIPGDGGSLKQSTMSLVLSSSLPLLLDDDGNRSGFVDVRPEVSAMDVVTCAHDESWDGFCVVPAREEAQRPSHDSASGRCRLALWRASQPQCQNGISTSKVSQLCPCRAKRPVTVHDVGLAMMRSPQGHTLVAAAFTRRGPADVHNASVWFLVDVSSYEYSFMPCWYGLGSLATSARLLENAFDMFLRSPRPTTAPPGATLPVASESLLLWQCSAMRQHPSAVRSIQQTAPTNTTQSLTQGTSSHDWLILETTPVYYALEKYADVAGHALELLINGVGQYIAEGLDKRGVPWLVPCSDDWRGNGARPLIWTRFFLELNEVFQFPVYPVDMGRVLDIDHRTVALRFATVHFATSYLAWNIACFKPTVLDRLWPHVKTAAMKHEWSSTLSHRLEEERQRFLPNSTTATANNVISTSSSSSHLDHRHHHYHPPQVNRIAFVKTLIHESVGSYASPDRAYLYSMRFQRLLLRHNVTSLSTTLPLLERMWAINEAELIVTTWGSALTTTMALMIAATRRGERSNQSTVGTRRRILVLVHHGYCHEAFQLFDALRHRLCAPKARRARIVRGGMSLRAFHLADVVDDNLCVKYLLVPSLRDVSSRDLAFSC